MISNPHTPVERLLWAYQFGHAWNRAPKYASLRNLDTGRIHKMTGDEADAKLLIGSWQDFEPNVERLVLAFHGRELQPDGGIGRASETAMTMLRCALPDFAPPAEAELDVIYDDPCLRGAVKSYQEYAEYRNDGKEFIGPEGSWPAAEPDEDAAPAEYVGGSGSWPKGCDPKFPNVHSTRVNLLTAGFSEHQRSVMNEVAAANERCPAEMGLSCRYILDGDPQECEHDVRGQFIAGGVIGFAYFPKPNTCNQIVIARIDNSFNPNKFTLGDLFEHEQGGHSRGKEHRSRSSSKKSIMHPSIATVNEWPTWKGDAGEFEMVAWFGGIPVPTDEPLPPPVPPPFDPWAGSVVTVQLQGQPPRRFIKALEV